MLSRQFNCNPFILRRANPCRFFTSTTAADRTNSRAATFNTRIYFDISSSITANGAGCVFGAIFPENHKNHQDMAHTGKSAPHFNKAVF